MYNQHSWSEELKQYLSLKEEVKHRLATCPVEERRAWSVLDNLINEKMSLAYAKNQDNSQG